MNPIYRKIDLLMTRNWYFKQGDQIQGPYSFQGLIELVRDETLSPDSLIRPQAEEDWQRADSVAGLFELGHSEQTADADNSFALANAGDLETFLNEPAETADTGEPPPAEVAHETTEEIDDEVETGAYPDETWSTTVKAAVDKIDSRNPKPEEEEEEAEPLQIVPEISLSFLQRPVVRMLMLGCLLLVCASAALYGFIQWMGEDQLYFPLIGETSPLLFLVYSACTLLAVLLVVPLLSYIAAPYLRLGYKLGAPLLTGTLTSLYLLHWTEQQNLIFPSRRQAEPKLLFPVMGECSAFSYWMYFVDVVIVVAVLTYVAARWLESHADEA
ncbi:hypothetical protein Pan153_51840 [Gimesia panareensis]|uniref:GYF domain-containing protein n=1 Tax=Gimesia panareensis TaxID=2527978 RepID=A0A518FVZ0_9PLAN|nr:DUF4339 domain-containing protein [Gimesia panareensis]QDV20509.1 hypothetical protein Pan153_51840 [Gimesia panareensis]